jgi:hypothetical protein
MSRMAGAGARRVQVRVRVRVGAPARARAARDHEQARARVPAARSDRSIHEVVGSDESRGTPTTLHALASMPGYDTYRRAPAGAWI